MSAAANGRLRQAGSPIFVAILASLLAFTGPIATAAADPLLLDVARAQAGFDARTGEPVISIVLTEASRGAFTTFTAGNIGRKTELRLDGRVLASPVIREPIAGGSMQISGALTVAGAKEIADKLSSANARIEVEVVPD
jgi:preprotein translocase subunit SecD